MKRARFIEKGVACDVFFPPNYDESSPMALYNYGFPGSIGENPVTRMLIDNGYVVLQPHYRGTYDSDREFSPHTAIATLRTIAEAVEHGNVINVKNLSPLNIPSKITVCVSHSFGCYVGLRAAKHLRDLKTLILMAPAITYGSGATGCGLNEDGESHIDYVRRSRPFTYRIGDYRAWEDLYNGLSDMMKRFKHPELTSVIGVVGVDDPYFELPVLSDRYEEIVKSAFGGDIQCPLVKVPEGAHGAASLLTSAVNQAIKKVL